MKAIDCVDRDIFFRPWDFVAADSWSPPIVEPDSQYTWQDRQRLEETGKLLQSSTRNEM